MEKNALDCVNRLSDCFKESLKDMFNIFLERITSNRILQFSDPFAS